MPVELARASSALQAANGALGHLGEPPIGSFEEQNPAARACKEAFGTVRDRVLRVAHWNFATDWQRPAADVPAKPLLGPFRYRFPLPDYWVAVRFVRDLEEEEWAVESAGDDGDAQVSALLCNIPNPEICGTKIVENVAKWDALFLSVFQYRLAQVIAPRVADSLQKGSLAGAEADRLLARAARIDAREKSRSKVPGNTTWIAVR